MLSWMFKKQTKKKTKEKQDKTLMASYEICGTNLLLLHTNVT